jgi:hypothetical protein
MWLRIWNKRPGNSGALNTDFRSYQEEMPGIGNRRSSAIVRWIGGLLAWARSQAAGGKVTSSET